MPRDADRTRTRLLTAARAEFAEHGIAGARVDRIAAAAKTNKQMIYAYFGNKDALFDTVFDRHIGEWLAEVDFDATDLPGYAGRLFDYFEADPAALRLVTWYRLERRTGPGLQSVVGVNEVRLTKLAEAQEKGDLSDRYTPVQLLALVQAIATSWSSMNPEFATAAGADRALRRRTVVTAVEQLIAG
ncbi:TetR family transcriptional regulator [Kibdelosporangium lantanae]